MGSYHPEAESPDGRVRAQLKLILDRIRRLEGKRTPLPLSVAPASTSFSGSTSATPVPMWIFTGPVPPGWQIEITALCNFTTDLARGGVVLRDQTGAAVASGTAFDGKQVIMQVRDAPMPLTLFGYTNAGSLSVTITEAQAAPWSGDSLDTGE